MVHTVCILQDCEMQLFSDFKHKYLVKFQSLVCNKNNFIQVSPVKANNMSRLALLNKRTSFCKTQLTGKDQVFFQPIAVKGTDMVVHFQHSIHYKNHQLSCLSPSGIAQEQVNTITALKKLKLFKTTTNNSHTVFGMKVSPPKVSLLGAFV